MAKLVMVIDTKRCTGCHTCAMACKVENNLPNNVWWNQVFSGKPEDFTGDYNTFTKGLLQENANLKIDVATGTMETQNGILNEKGQSKKIDMSYFTKACQHCEKPACLEACNYGAIYKDPDTGIVDADFSKCIGCDACIVECPYDVRHHNTSNEEWYIKEEVGGQGIDQHKPETVDKCTFCHHRVKEGLQPFCVENCPAGARSFGNIDDPTSKVYHLIYGSGRTSFRMLEDKGTGPSVYFLK